MFYSCSRHPQVQSAGARHPSTVPPRDNSQAKVPTLPKASTVRKAPPPLLPKPAVIRPQPMQTATQYAGGKRAARTISESSDSSSNSDSSIDIMSPMSPDSSESEVMSPVKEFVLERHKVSLDAILYTLVRN